MSNFNVSYIRVFAGGGLFKSEEGVRLIPKYYMVRQSYSNVKLSIKIKTILTAVCVIK